MYKYYAFQRKRKTNALYKVKLPRRSKETYKVIQLYNGSNWGEGEVKRRCTIVHNDEFYTSICTCVQLIFKVVIARSIKANLHCTRLFVHMFNPNSTLKSSSPSDETSVLGGYG